VIGATVSVSVVGVTVSVVDIMVLVCGGVTVSVFTFTSEIGIISVSVVEFWLLLVA